MGGEPESSGGMSRESNYTREAMKGPSRRKKKKTKDSSRRGKRGEEGGAFHYNAISMLKGSSVAGMYPY